MLCMLELKLDCLLAGTPTPPRLLLVSTVVRVARREVGDDDDDEELRVAPNDGHIR